MRCGQGHDETLKILKLFDEVSLLLGKLTKSSDGGAKKSKLHTGTGNGGGAGRSERYEPGTRLG